MPYLWVLWDLWGGRIDVLRGEVNANNFYELQARAMMHGHFTIPNGSIGIEAFVHDGRQYTYFGLFPSILRMPVLVFTRSLDGRLTAPSILLAWVVTALFCALLLWRVRTIVRGPAPLGRMEAASYGVLMATVMAGSVLVMLAATPFVYDEDFAWSVALTVGALFALIGVMERPSRMRMVLAGVLVLGATLNRAPTGGACVIGVVLIAGWFALGRRGPDNRKWAVPLLGIALGCVVVTVIINLAKFGSPLGFSLTNQLYTQQNAHRAYYLSTTGGKGYSLRFIPSTLLAYFGPAGLRLTPVFPFITMPAAPAAAVGGVVLEWQYRTYSATATMPLLLVLTIVAGVATLRRRAGRIALFRIPLLIGLIGCAGVIVWGYLAPRYIADILPLLIIGGCVGLVFVWRRLRGRSRNIQLGVLAVVAAVGAYGIVANVAAASTPAEQWNMAQLANYVRAQKAVSDATGRPLVHNVEQGANLPLWAPADKLFIIGSCKAFYISNGMNYANSPSQQFEHLTWMPVQYGPGIVYNVDLRLDASSDQMKGRIPILKVGHDTIWMEAPSPSEVAFGLADPHSTTSGQRVTLAPKFDYPIQLIVDPYLRVVSMMTFGNRLLLAEWPNGQVPPVQTVPATPGGYPYAVSISSPPTDVGLCQSIQREVDRSGHGHAARTR